MRIVDKYDLFSRDYAWHIAKKIEISNTAQEWEIFGNQIEVAIATTTV